jgi:hypothetical protein
MKIASAGGGPVRAPGHYSLAMHEGARGRGSSPALAAVRRVARWQPRSYLQIWAIAATGYLVCPVLFIAVLGWYRSGGAEFVSAAMIWSGVGAGQSYRLHRRRTG